MATLQVFIIAATAMCAVAVPILEHYPHHEIVVHEPIHHIAHVEPHHHPKYEFKYGVHDSHTQDIKEHAEKRDGDRVEGYYRLQEADGTIRTVKYTADHKTGFHAQVLKTGHATHPTGRIVIPAPSPVVISAAAPSPIVVPAPAPAPLVLQAAPAALPTASIGLPLPQTFGF